MGYLNNKLLRIAICVFILANISINGQTINIKGNDNYKNDIQYEMRIIDYINMTALDEQNREEISIIKPKSEQKGILEIISYPENPTIVNQVLHDKIIKNTFFNNYKSKKSEKTLTDEQVYEDFSEFFLRNKCFRAYRFNPISEVFFEEVPDSQSELPYECQQAISISPKWLSMELEEKFITLKPFNLHKTYADIILSAAEKDPRIVDEVAFCITYMSIESLKDTRILHTQELLIDNAEWIYKVDDSLKFVDIVEYGDFNGGNYYTTTKYKVRIGDDGQEFWSEIPKEIYYWYVVMPKLNLEGVYKEDKINSSSQRTFDYFWREYLWNNPNPEYDYTKVYLSTQHGSIDTIRRFGELMQHPDILWDRINQYFLFGRDYTENDHAMNMIGNWTSRCVPADPQTIRPHQPNQIAYCHRGRCGEDSYLVAAACRTALIPMIVLTTSREDHAFGAFWDEDWEHFEFFRGGLARNGWGWTNLKGGKYYEEASPDYWVMSYVFGFRPDGFLSDFTKYYTDVCKLRITVMDKTGLPVDGAKIILYASPGHPSINDNAIAYAGEFYTNGHGVAEVEAGDEEYYFYQIYHPKFGTFPSETNANILVGQMINNSLTGMKSQAGFTYKAEVTLNNFEMPYLDISEIPMPEESDYYVEIKWNVIDVITGKSRDGQKSTFNYVNPDSANSTISIFFCNSDNYDKFQSGHPFDAYNPVQYTLENMDSWFVNIPKDDKDYFLVVSNQNAISNHKIVTLDNKVFAGSTSSVSDNAEYDINISPNPFSTSCKITSKPGTKIDIFNIYGIIVYSSSESNINWQPEEKAAGVYFIKTTNSGIIKFEKVIYQP